MSLRTVLLTVALLSLGSACLAVDPSYVDNSGGSQTTGNGAWSAWGKVFVPGNPSSAVSNPLEVRWYDVDLSGMKYTGAWDASYYGYANVGLTNYTAGIGLDQPLSVWDAFQSDASGQTLSNSGSKTYTNADPTRRWLGQTWTKATGGKTRFMNNAYIREGDPSNAAPGDTRANSLSWDPQGTTPSPYDPDEYDTFDIALKLTPMGSGLWRVESDMRLHRSWSYDDSRYWYNPAMNVPTEAWKPFMDLSDTRDYVDVNLTGLDMAKLYPFISVGNGNSGNGGQSITWGRMEIYGDYTVPEPGTLGLLFALGVPGLIAWRRRRKAG